jgi:hypothetical protein
MQFKQVSNNQEKSSVITRNLNVQQDLPSFLHENVELKLKGTGFTFWGIVNSDWIRCFQGNF